MVLSLVSRWIFAAVTCVPNTVGINYSWILARALHLSGNSSRFPARHTSANLGPLGGTMLSIAAATSGPADWKAGLGHCNSLAVARDPPTVGKRCIKVLLCRFRIAYIRLKPSSGTLETAVALSPAFHRNCTCGIPGSGARSAITTPRDTSALAGSGRSRTWTALSLCPVC